MTQDTPQARASHELAREARERWFEVWVGQDCIDVITRMMDEVTNNIAQGFAKLCARWWEGEIED
jgi:hypothetical protein